MSLFENPTQTMGIIAFLSTFLSCVLAGRFATWTIWRWLAAIYLFFVLEIALGWRHGLRLVVNDALQSVGIYGDRTMIQLALVATLLLIVILISLPYKMLANKIGPRRKNHYVAICATVLLFLLLIVELISFHRFDYLLYQTSGSIMLIGWIWAGLAIVIMASALLNLRDICSPSNSEGKHN